MSVKTKAFLESMLIHAKDPQKVKKMLTQDKRLSRDEKSIVKCFLLMRRNKNEEALGMVEDIRTQQDSFVESMRLFILAGVLNNLNQHRKAMIHFEASYRILPKNELSHFEFIVLLNLFQLNINLRDLKAAYAKVEQMKQIHLLNHEDHLILTKCLFNYHTLTENLKEADKALIQINQEIHRFQDHTLSVFFLDLWDYGIVFKKFDVCLDVLEKMKQQKTYILSQNYNYMKILLMHYLHQEPVYVVEHEFKDYPDLLMQLKVIRALECNKQSEAQMIWDGLHRIKPHIFARNFEMKGQKTILQLCLEKYRSKLTEKKPVQIRNSKLSISDNIEEILQQHDEISKEDLFQFLYGRAPESKDDLNRLARDIYKLKTTKQLKIDSKRGKYALIKKAS